MNGFYWSLFYLSFSTFNISNWNEYFDLIRGGFKTGTDYLKAYSEAIDEIISLQNTHGYNAAVFTQLTDVEAELNGFFSYDRRIEKVDLKRIIQLNQKLFSSSIE